MAGRVSKSSQGKRNRTAGARFELKVRSDLEKQGWVVSKWQNNVDLEKREIVKVRPKFNPFTKTLMMNTPGFPDFIAIRRSGKKYDVIGVEVKANGWLDKSEKEKCRWLLSNKIFSRMLIAKRGEKRGKIEYAEFR